MKIVAGDSECVVETSGPEETERLGRMLGTQLIPGEVVALIGELGTGKTCFTRGIALGLGIDNSIPIVSPSFAIINEYPGPIPLYHFDLYRIEDPDQIFDLGYQEYFFGKGVTVIEWGEKAQRFLPQEHITVNFFFLNETVRKIKIKAPEKRSLILQKIMEAVNY